MMGQNFFLDHYETKCWSNVACANRKLFQNYFKLWRRLSWQQFKTKRAWSTTKGQAKCL